MKDVETKTKSKPNPAPGWRAELAATVAAGYLVSYGADRRPGYVAKAALAIVDAILEEVYGS